MISLSTCSPKLAIYVSPAGLHPSQSPKSFPAAAKRHRLSVSTRIPTPIFFFYRYMARKRVLIIMLFFSLPGKENFHISLVLTLHAHGRHEGQSEGSSARSGPRDFLYKEKKPETSLAPFSMEPAGMFLIQNHVCSMNYLEMAFLLEPSFKSI